jgi:hypothetical protein
VTYGQRLCAIAAALASGLALMVPPSIASAWAQPFRANLIEAILGA